MILAQILSKFLENSFVLVVEPAPNYRSSLKNFLTNLKVKNVRYAASVAEAKREMLTIKVGLFICEWQLPEKNGLIFCREMRKNKNYRTTPFLLMSTENLRKDVILASEGGINAYLLKPFSYEDFCGQINILVQQNNAPNALNQLLERAESHIDENELWVAEALLKEALVIKSTSARAFCGLGRVHFLNKDIPQAITNFQKAVELNPEYVDGYKYILAIAESRSDVQGILQVASILHSISPENPRYPLLIASAHMELNNLNDSEHFFKITVKLSPTLSDGYRGLGNVYMQKKDYDKAMKTLEKALDLEKGDIPTLNSLGLAYVRQGLTDEGIRRYKMALALDPHDPRVHFNLGLAYEIKSEIQMAKESFQRAIAVEPGMEKAKRGLDRMLKSTRSAQGSISKIEEEGELEMPKFKKEA